LITRSLVESSYSIYSYILLFIISYFNFIHIANYFALSYYWLYFEYGKVEAWDWSGRYVERGERWIISDGWMIQGTHAPYFEL